MRKKANAYAVLILIILTSIIFIGYYAVLPGFAKVYRISLNESMYLSKTTESGCDMINGYWEGGLCRKMPERARNLTSFMRGTWLVAPFIFVIGLIIWAITVSSKKDPREFYFR